MRHTKTAPCVPSIITKLEAWREGGIRDGYKGITDTTRTLLNHWFFTDHRRPGAPDFKYHTSQQLAIETLIYLFEVAQTRRQRSLLETFSTTGDLRLLQHDDFARYCVKMATGSGKTKVISLAIAWQYFNAVNEDRDDFAKTSLLIAPNVIVFERLKTDFQNGRIFKSDPVIPKELQVMWDYQVYLRGEPERAGSIGALYLTNVQQLHEREDLSDEPEPIAEVMGSKPPSSKVEIEDFAPRIIRRRGPVLVLNDEAHHTHDEDSVWNQTIRNLHGSVPGGLCAQLDFTATPRHTKGTLFTWTVFDYPLKNAIQDGIVKRPMKGITTGISERPSPLASVKFQAYLTAGVERWKEYRDQLAPFKKKPVLFVMLNSTAEADDVGDWLRVKYPEEFGGEKLLIIHTDTKGEITKKDLDKARRLARDIDDDKSPVTCVVSVLMLREGWDVQNVTVIVGLRPYTAKANILPEQTIGRGLRRMFRGVADDYVERVDIIGNKAFIEFIERLEKEEDLELSTFVVGKDKLEIVDIQVDPNKLAKDITLPVLSPILTRKKSLADEIAAIDVMGFQCPVLPKKEGDTQFQKFRYEGFDIVTLKREIEREYVIKEMQTPEEVIGYYARRIANDVKLPSQFAVLVPKVREFLERKAFGEEVKLDEPAILKALNSNVAMYVTIREFVKALRAVVIEDQKPQLIHDGRKLSETEPFPWSRRTVEADRTVFNKVACDNEFEAKFASFLQTAPEVEAFAKLPSQFQFSIEYSDSVGNLRYYHPDFVIRDVNGIHVLAETKGQEDIDVPHKDRAAQIWCENATRLTGREWRYMKVPEKEYNKLQPTLLADLDVFQA